MVNQEEKDKKIEVLKKFFVISNAAFDFASIIQGQVGMLESNGKYEKMKELHKECLQEINKPDIGLERIDQLILQMEILASQPLPPKNFKKGGI